jgi:hypothetical protein
MLITVSVFRTIFAYRLSERGVVERRLVDNWRGRLRLCEAELSEGKGGGGGVRPRSSYARRIT